ncbi:MAG: type II toxin-antitoxin system HipA family toxin YjjJ [Deltaproteobacteria bacterium]|nr:type II toxin-antitoxin system HipA family toxin YjjJ [Deltaproteobacteria bacterium]
MPRSTVPADSLLSLLRRRGPTPARELQAELRIAQPTLSRLVRSGGDAIIRFGRARATRYAVRRDVEQLGDRWDVHRIDAAGRARLVATLHALHPKMWWYEAEPRPAWLRDEPADGLFSDLPWFLDDLRPQGFLGRAFATRYRHELGLGPDLRLWSSSDVLKILLLYGDDLPGDFVVGERALTRVQHASLGDPPSIPPDARISEYARLADAAIAGEPAGSSAGGEQPKFTACVCDGADRRHVLVKFALRDSSVGERWSDLLLAEHLAAESLRAHGIAACETEWIDGERRCYLEIRRFDRVGAHGRRGVTTLHAFQSAHGDLTADWLAVADELTTGGWLFPDDADTIRIAWWFGVLIGNTDMHLANLALFIDDDLPLGLAPLYDMLPMHYRPTTTGELPHRDLVPALPKPRQLAAWRRAAIIAESFWQLVAADARFTSYFRTEAGHMTEMLARLRRRFD